MNDLDIIALKHGTDKASSHHNYTRIYHELFTNRVWPMTLVELGVDKGHSLRTWLEWFANGQIYGIDMQHNPLFPIHERCFVEIGDGTDPNFVGSFINSHQLSGKIDVFIDDGSHRTADQVLSFLLFWPHIKPGGMYVIEDLHTNYGPEATMNFSHKITDYLRYLMDEINWNGRWHDKGQGNTTMINSGIPLRFDYGPVASDEKLSYMSRTIDSMHIYKSMVVLKKRAV